MMSNKVSQFVIRHRVAGSVLGITLLGAVIVFGAMAGAQQAPEYDPPLPPSMAEPPGKPQYDGTPTPDPVRRPSSRVCSMVPGLCGLATSLSASHARGDLSAFTSLLSPSQVPCSEPVYGARTPGQLCAAQPDSAQVSGYTIMGLGKRASVTSEAELTSLLSSWLQIPAGAGTTPVVATPLSVGCAITPGEDVDCSVSAIALGLADAKTKATNGVVVLFFRQGFGGRPFALVGASAGLDNGAVLTGGTERRIMAGWTGNKTGGWYFELLEPRPGR